MASRLYSIREACNLAPDMRSDDNVNDILEFVKDVKFFARLGVLQQRTLCRTMSLEEFGPREFVFQMGELGDKFYIILAGSVGVQVPSQTAPCPNDVHADKCDCPNRPLETVVFLEKGMGFGELALQSDQPRSATIQASEKTELLVTKRANYEMYAGQLHRQFIQQRVKFLRQCPRIEDALQAGHVSTQDIAAMANCLNEVHLTGNAVACRQGEVVDHMIFVRSGQLATLRSVDPDARREVSATRMPDGVKRGRPSLVDAAEILPSGDPIPESEGGDAGQSKAQLSTNLAKLIMENKRRDRKKKLEDIEQKEQEQEAEGWRKRGLAAPEATVGAADRRSPTNNGEESRGKQLWRRLQASFRQVVMLGKLADMCVGGGAAPKPEQGKPGAAGRQSVEHLLSVQAARRRYTQFTFKKMEEEKKGAKRAAGTQLRTHNGRFSRQMPKAKAQVETAPAKRRVRMLRVGTIGPYQYFGDKHVCNNDCWPVSLVSDPVAEIYVMSKHDILRRVPKKLFSALFTAEKEAVPTDTQLLDMHRQTQRWNAFRRSMHGEALMNVSARSQKGLRGQFSGSRIDAVANLEFLGVHPKSALGESRLTLPSFRGTALRPKDEELYSQVSARFLRRFDIMKRDPGLRGALARSGLMRSSRLHDGLPGSALDDGDQDPMAFHLDQHWYRLQRDQDVGLDLDDDISEDASKLATAAAKHANSIVPGRRSVRNHSKLVSGGAYDSDDSAPDSAGGNSMLSNTAGGGTWPSMPPVSPPRSSHLGGARAPQRRLSARHDAGGVVELPPIFDSTPRGEGSGRVASAEHG